MKECRKASFSKKQDAENRLAEILIECKKKKEKHPIRVYFCEDCQTYHLTSITKFQKVNIDKTREIRIENRLNAEAAYWANRKQWK